MFTVLGRVKDYTPTAKDTYHCQHERVRREHVVSRLLKDEDAVMYTAIEVDTGHKNGTEIHVIYTNGIVRIYNTNTGKHITDLIVRPNQLRRYNILINDNMLSLAKQHVRQGLNY